MACYFAQKKGPGKPNPPPLKNEGGELHKKTASWVCLRRCFYPLLFNHLAMVGQSDFSL
jgi:hypothetical protein